MDYLFGQLLGLIIEIGQEVQTGQRLNDVYGREKRLQTIKTSAAIVLVAIHRKDESKDIGFANRV